MVTNQSQRDAAAMFRLGARVDRATATLPQTTNSAIFTISGGRIFASLIIGEVTVAIQAQANATKLIGVPSAGSNVDLCATADINGLEVGGKLVPVGVLATALGKTNAGGAAGPSAGLIVPVGTINLSCAASNTGSIKWSIFYVPIDDGALVVAA
jgi:hypothetical protein